MDKKTTAAATIGLATVAGSAIGGAFVRRKRRIAAGRSMLAGVARTRQDRVDAQHQQRRLENEVDAARRRISALEHENLRLQQRSAMKALIHDHVPTGASVVLLGKGKGDPFALDDHAQLWLVSPDEPRCSDAELMGRLDALIRDGALYAAVPATSAAWLSKRAALDRHIRSSMTLRHADDVGCALYEAIPDPVAEPEPAAELDPVTADADPVA